NAGPCAAFRAPGQVQGIFSLEQAMDELADRLQLDPLILRDRIDTKPTDDMLARAHERKVAAERFGWSRRRPPNADAGPIKRGIGMAQAQWVYVVSPPTTVEVRVADDGSVSVYNSTQDVGTGTRICGAGRALHQPAWAGRCPVRRGGGRCRDRRGQGRAHRRCQRLRQADQPQTGREPGDRRHHPGCQLRDLRGPHHGRGERPSTQRQCRSIQDGRITRDSGDRGAAHGADRGAVVDRRARHRRGKQCGDQRRDRQCILQRHRKADPHFADEPGKCAGDAQRLRSAKRSPS
ncbi:MAG: hypothetical protein E5Y60_28590, partial [Mesorhizobium sp.]